MTAGTLEAPRYHLGRPDMGPGRGHWNRTDLNPDGNRRDARALAVFLEHGERARDAIEHENERGRYDGAPLPSCTAVIVARARAATEAGPVTIGTEHYYADNRHRIVVHGAAGRALHDAKQRAWHEVSGYATGYAHLRDSATLRAVAELAGIPDRPGGSALVHIVDDAGRIIHIGSMSRPYNGSSTWELAG